MDLSAKLKLLGEQAQFDVSAPGVGAHDLVSQEDDLARRLTGCIYPAAVGGKCLPVLKVLLTNACSNNCHYCATRCSADVPRASFHPEELARAFIQMERRGLVRGLFLSSGIVADPDETQRRIIDTAAILRQRYHYRGYIHLKIVPGCSASAIEETVRLASRVSVNIEAPDEARLQQIAPDKTFADGVMATLRLASQAAREIGLRSGVTTQYVAGAAGESDADLLFRSWQLYRQLGLRRAYYSAFRPVPESPLQDVPPMPERREHRLYQADWLLRFYGFSPEELVFDNRGLLPQEVDPKLAWARHHPEYFPVELQTASRQELLRVPGIGPIAADRLVALRSREGLAGVRTVRELGLPARSAPYVLIRGRKPDEMQPDQLPLPLQ